MCWYLTEIQAARAPHPAIMGGACADAALASPPESGLYKEGNQQAVQGDYILLVVACLFILELEKH